MSTSKSASSKSTTRRKFVLTAGATCAAAIAMPQVSRAQTVTWKYMSTWPMGWFKKEIKSGDDFKGMKYRTVGLSADLFKEMGAAVTILAGGEIVPAMDRGLLDAAEFNNPSSDILLGFPDVSKFYMMGSHHQQMEAFEVIFNKQKFDALAPELKAILRNAAHSASADNMYTAYDRYPKDLEEIRKRNVNVIHTGEK